MTPSKDELLFPDFLTITDVEWDERGFRDRGDASVILWADVVQVALVFEMSPSLAIIEPETYLAFRLKNPQLSVWICSTFVGPFVAEIERRFAPLVAPSVARWKESDRCIVSYSIWPPERKGEPLYVNFREHWWSSKALLALPKRPNKAPEPTPTAVTSPATQEPRQP